MAERLVASLAAERERWAAEVAQRQQHRPALVGDALLAATLVCYVGALTGPLRTRLLEAQCKPDMRERRIPLTPALNPLDLLAPAAVRAGWQEEGLAGSE
eukprot:2321320-Rhodomonas_salina.1